MKLKTRWNQRLRFTAGNDLHSIPLDSRPPLGEDTGLTPKHLLLGAACGCTGMDVVSLLRKFKQPLDGLEVDAEATTTEGVSPVTFTAMKLTFRFTGQLDKEKALEAIHLSQTKYCGVSAMLTKAFPISYDAYLNGELIGSGEARFT